MKIFVTCTFVSFYLTYRSCLCLCLCSCSSDADGVPAKKRKRNESEEEILKMMENTENPLRCPVRLYEFYLSKWFVALFFMHFSLVVLLTLWLLYLFFLLFPADVML